MVQDVRSCAMNENGRGETGAGKTIDMSGSGLLFTSDRPLMLGQRLEVFVCWPACREGRRQLELAVYGVVVRTESGRAAISILGYEFRAAGEHGAHRDRGLTNRTPNLSPAVAGNPARVLPRPRRRKKRGAGTERAASGT